ncbi:MAG: hypothetical protein KY443_06745 [Actinobacteria bacterium]|nr:hypothetical protein [Actinomycetota bacterium]
MVDRLKRAALWRDEARGDGASRVTWHVSGVKAWLETGEVLTTPGSLLYT